MFLIVLVLREFLLKLMKLKMIFKKCKNFQRIKNFFFRVCASSKLDDYLKDAYDNNPYIFKIEIGFYN